MHDYYVFAHLSFMQQAHLLVKELITHIFIYSTT